MGTPVLLAHAIKDSTDIFGISGGGGFEHPPRYATGGYHNIEVGNNRFLFYVWNFLHVQHKVEEDGGAVSSVLILRSCCCISSQSCHRLFYRSVNSHFVQMGWSSDAYFHWY